MNNTRTQGFLCKLHATLSEEPSFHKIHIGCADNSDCKVLVDSNTNNADSRCTVPVGKVWLESIKVSKNHPVRYLYLLGQAKYLSMAPAPALSLRTSFVAPKSA